MPPCRIFGVAGQGRHYECTKNGLRRHDRQAVTHAPEQKGFSAASNFEDQQLLGGHGRT